MAEIHGIASWPGVIAVEGCTYTCSTGISPGVAILKVQPQAKPIPAFGALTLTDEVHGKIVLPDARISGKIEERGPGGTVWSLAIEDRRWKWPRLGNISGSYNGRDPHGKLIPWTIRSPEELVRLCLAAMGETVGDIDMPPGLAYKNGAGIQELLFNGQNFIENGNNPPIEWDNVPPAQALQELCDRFGRIIAYQVKTQTVSVYAPGEGLDLPANGVSIEQLSPTTNPPVVPSAVGVIGAPVRYQAMILLEAVGRDWDSSWRPINALSFRPLPVADQAQITTVTPTNPQPGLRYDIFITPNGADPSLASNQVFFEYVSQPGDTADSIAAALAALINASTNPGIQGQITANVGSGALTLTGTPQAGSFDVQAGFSGNTPPPDGTTFGAETAQLWQGASNPWAYSRPPDFANVRAVDGRLTYDDARRLARAHVFKSYRVTVFDPSDPKGVEGNTLLTVPGYGKIVRREQLLLEETQVDQVVPQEHDANVKDPGTGNPMTVALYSAYSRDREAQVFGAVSREHLTNYVIYPGSTANTLSDGPFEVVHWEAGTGEPNNGSNQQVLVPFAIDNDYQVITFSDYVYYLDGNKVREPNLVLLTAVQVRNAVTNQIERFTKLMPLDSGLESTPPLWVRHEDCQLNVTSHYDCQTDRQGKTTCKLTKAGILEADPIARANFYLLGEALKLQVAAGATVRYSGLLPIELSGVVRQVTWRVGRDGCTTQASANAEHDVYVPSAPARRRAERLAAVESNPQFFDNARIDLSKPKE